jgi:thymidylate kinase
MKTQKNIVKIVITGGPCGGKSTVLKSIKEALEKAEYKTFIAQEMATRLFESGVEISEKGISLYQFQEQLLLRQIDEENFIKNLAETHNYDNVVILCDRGIMDGQAYISEEDFDKILTNNGYTRHARDERYDVIIHLVTTAYGAEKFYKNNKVRKDTIIEARILDDKIKEVWKPHHYVQIIDNSTCFQEKIDRTIKTIFSFLQSI